MRVEKKSFFMAVFILSTVETTLLTVWALLPRNARLKALG